MLHVALLGCTLGAGCGPAVSGRNDDQGSSEVRIQFSANRADPDMGECATLSWAIEGGSDYRLDGESVDGSGERVVCPVETTVYALTVDAGKWVEQREIAVVLGGSKAPPGAFPPRSTDKVTIIRDLPYGAYEFREEAHPLLLDLYLPAETSARPPLLIFIHGGGWFEGSKSTCPGMTFADHGFAMACVDYRLSNGFDGCPPELGFPAQIHDVKSAVRWLRGNADRFGFDSERVGALGASSGGHLAALLGVSHGVMELAGNLNLGFSDAIQAVGDWYGPVDAKQEPPRMAFEEDPCTTPLAELDAKYKALATPAFYLTWAWGTFLGGSLKDPAVLARARSATPLSYIDAGDPPFLVLHGEADQVVPIGQSEILVKALEQAGVEVAFVRVPGGHSYASERQEVDDGFLTPTLEFFRRRLTDP